MIYIYRGIVSALESWLYLIAGTKLTIPEDLSIRAKGRIVQVSNSLYLRYCQLPNN